MPASSSDQDEVISQINITPLVDIVLVVLLVFIVTTSIIMKSSINMDLPKASSGKDLKEELVNIAVTKDNIIYINGKPSEFDDISVFFIEKKNSLGPKNWENISVLVSADSEISYGKFVKIIDLVREEGISNIALDVSPISLKE